MVIIEKRLLFNRKAKNLSLNIRIQNQTGHHQLLHWSCGLSRRPHRLRLPHRTIAYLLIRRKRSTASQFRQHNRLPCGKGHAFHWKLRQKADSSLWNQSWSAYRSQTIRHSQKKEVSLNVTWSAHHLFSGTWQTEYINLSRTQRQWTE